MWVGQRSKLKAAGAVLAAATLIVTAAGCDLLNRGDEDPPVINNYVTGIEVPGDVLDSQEVVNQQLGTGDAGGPAAKVGETTTVVNGGSVQVGVASDQEFTAVRVALEELLPDSESGEVPASTGAPSRGYHEIKLKQASTAIDIVVSVAQAMPGQNFVLYFAVVDGSGEQGPPAAQSVEAVNVGAGVVQVSVSWDVDSDLDLHVVDPDGEEIYYGNLESLSGGELDLDSNADCEIDHVRNENVAWGDEAPAGTYTVRVDLYDSCGVAPTNYVVTINVQGQPSHTYTGSIDGDGDVGAEGDGQDVATFELEEPIVAAPTEQD